MIITIAWIDLTLNIKPSILKNQTIRVLNNISGYLTTNSLNAIMGPSGAGKTTLLKCLSGKLMNGLSNETNVMNQKRKIQYLFHKTGYFRTFIGWTDCKTNPIIRFKIEKLANNQRFRSQSDCVGSDVRAVDLRYKRQ